MERSLKILVDKILNIAVETNSYRDAAEQIMQLLNISISHETVRDIVIKAGMKIIEKENEEIKLDKKGQISGRHKRNTSSV